MKTAQFIERGRLLPDEPLSSRAMNYVMELYTDPAGGRITPTEKLVLLVLAHYHNDALDESWPSLTLLAEQCLLSKQGLLNNLARLQQKGLLAIARRGPHPGRGMVNSYSFPLLPPIVQKGQPALLLPEQEGSICLTLQGTERINVEQENGQVGRSAIIGTRVREVLRNHEKKEKKREDTPLPPKGGAEQQSTLIDWILSEWRKIPGVFHQERLLGESSTAKGITRMLKEHPQRAWWLELFAVVAASPFLCGANVPAPGRPRWRASLGWLMGLKNGPENLAKTLEGAYLRHPDDRPYVCGKFCPSGSLEWAAREDAKDAASAAHGEIGQTSGGRAIAQLEPVLATGEAEKNKLPAALEVTGEARSPNLPLDCSLVVDAEAVLVFLNDQTGQHFRAWESSGAMSEALELVVSRLKSGATAERCRQMIAFKVQDWIRIPRLAACLVPETLFHSDNFKKYCAQLAANLDAAQADAERPELLAVGNPCVLLQTSGKGD